MAHLETPAGRATGASPSHTAGTQLIRPQQFAASSMDELWQYACRAAPDGDLSLPRA
jgi:hypothetical protein